MNPDLLTVPQLVAELRRLSPDLLAGAFGERHYRAGLYFRALKAKSLHGEYEKNVKATGFSVRHSQTLRQLAAGIEEQGIPLESIKAMTFDKLYESVITGKKAERKEDLEAYWTPPELIAPLLARERFPGIVWEPAVGAGNIAKCFADGGYRVLASDVKDYGYPETRIADFYTDEAPGRFNSIVTNPPYACAWKWVGRCVGFRPEKLALLMPASTLGDCAKVLPESGYSLTRILMFRRPPKFRGPSGTADVNWGAAWFVFELGEGKPGEVESLEC